MFCSKCGAQLISQGGLLENAEEKPSGTLAFWMAAIFGFFGLHCFMVRFCSISYLGSSPRA